MFNHTLYRFLVKLSEEKQILMALVLALFLRGVTLEMLDLVDTTESRYAAIAYDMVRSGNYITPMIPEGTDHVPYLGKPAGHFWLMALSYKLFGMDEWTSRLPSFIGLCLIVYLLIYLGKRTTSRLVCNRSALIACTSLLLFFFSGAALLDVTLSACVVGSLVFAFVGLTDNSHPVRDRLFFWMFLAGGFLIKGPIALVLSWIPLMAWVLFSKKFLQLWRLISLSSASLFLLIALPWFLLAERANPGFLQYFFVNENILRYFIKEYGDKYGTGHVLPYGSSWGIFLICFFPWSGLLLSGIYSQLKGLKKQSFNSSKSNELFTFSLFWTFTPLIFFTFLRQFHPGYLVAVIPGASLLTSELIAIHGVKFNLKAFSQLTGIGVLCSSFIFSSYDISFKWVLIGVALGLIILFSNVSKKAMSLPRFSVIILACYAAIIGTWVPVVNARRSSERIINCITYFSPNNTVELAILGKRSYSAHLLAESAESELYKPINLTFVDYVDLESLQAKNLLVRRSNEGIKIANYSLKAKLGTWYWLSYGPSSKVDCSLVEEAA